MDRSVERTDHFLYTIADSETVQYTAARASIAEPICTIEDLVRQSTADAALDATSGTSAVLIQTVITGLRVLHQEAKSGFDFRPNKVLSYPEGIAFTRKNDKEIKYLDMQQSETVRLLLYGAPESITGVGRSDVAATELADIWGLGCLCLFILSHVDPQFYVTGSDGKRINLNTYKNPVIALTATLGKGTICPEYLGYCRDSIFEGLLNDCLKPDLYLRSGALKKLIHGELYNASPYGRKNCAAQKTIITGHQASPQKKMFSEEIRYLNKGSKKLDLDNNGSLSVDELASLPELQQNPLVQRIIDIFDTQLNRKVNLKELIHGISQVTVKGDSESKLRFLFSIYDIDRDGFIAAGELFQVLKMMVGDNLRDQQLQQIVDKTITYADKDGDGKISFDEFCSLTGHTGVHKKLFGGIV